MKKLHFSYLGLKSKWRYLPSYLLDIDIRKSLDNVFNGRF